jgi:adenylyltransferase/sulfurtransferase
MTDLSRYSRQIVLSEIGEAGQEKLASSKILIVGAGGLGCPALLYLAAAGVGNIGIIDFDNVEITNLQRQILFHDDQQGINKAIAASENIKSLNPEINVTPYDEELTDENVLGIFEQYDVIIDGTDSFSAKFLINDAAVKSGKPVIYGSILGFEGQASVFYAAKGPCYRCLYPAPPASHVPNCAEAGIIGAVAGMVGSVQAMEAIKIITGENSFSPLIGKLWITNIKTMESSVLEIPKNKDCPVCSKSLDTICLEYEKQKCSLSLEEIDVLSARKLKDVLFIDVRESNEWNEGHIEGALHMPLSELKENKGIDVPSNRQCIIYCGSGIRSMKALQIFIDNGIGNAKSMTGGYTAWCKAS